MKISVRALFLGSMLPLLISAAVLLVIALSPYYLSVLHETRLKKNLEDSIEVHHAALAVFSQLKYYTNSLLEDYDVHKQKIKEIYPTNHEKIQRVLDNPAQIGAEYVASLKQLTYDLTALQEKMEKADPSGVEDYTRISLSLLAERPPNRLMETESQYLNVQKESIRVEIAYLESNARNSLFPVGMEFKKKLQTIFYNYQQLAQLLHLRLLVNAYHVANATYLFSPQASTINLQTLQENINETLHEIEKIQSSASTVKPEDEAQEGFFKKLEDEIHDYTDASEFYASNMKTSDHEALRKFAGDYLIDLNELITQGLIAESITRVQEDIDKDMGYVASGIRQSAIMAVISAIVIFAVIVLTPIVLLQRLIKPIVKLHDHVTSRYKLLESENKQGSVGGRDEVDELVQTFELIHDEISESRDEIVLRQSVTSACSTATSVEQATEICLELISQHAGWAGGHAYMRNKETMLMTVTPVWYMGDEKKMRPLRELIEKQYTIEGESLVSKVMETRRPAWHKVILLNTKVLTEQEALKQGIKGMIAIPVLVKGAVHAVLEFFSEHEVAPSDRLLLVLVNTAIQLGRVIERQNWEGALVEAREEAEEANKAKSEFLTNMSHELRTPMHAILGFAKLAIKGIEKNKFKPEELKKHFENILTSGNRLLGFLNALLDISKLESGKTVYQMQVNDMMKAIENVQREIQSLLDQKRITLEVVKASPDTETKAYFDQEKLVQVIMNLVSNAIKFSPEGGKITVRVSRAHIALKKTVDEMMDATQARMAEGLQVTVEDEGEGIPAGETEYVFDKFMQSSRSIGKKEGTGLGLAISREIVVDHGGKIFAANRPEGGAIFTVQIPLEKMRVEESQK